MTKLKRQTISELSDRLFNAIDIDASDIFAEQYCKSEDVAALEAENGRLMAALQECIIQRFYPEKVSEISTDIILDHEQEKQP